jgi:hypothetical protein
VAEATGRNGQIAVLDPSFTNSAVTTLTPQTLDVGSLANVRKAKVREYTVAPTTFASPPATIPVADLKVASGVPGILRTEVPWQNAYGIDVVRGEVWVGTAGRVAHVRLQTIGSETDLVAPAATQLGGAADAESRIDILLHNTSDQPIAGEALYIFSPGYFAARQTFSLAPGGTAILTDAFGDLGSATVPLTGPIRVRVTTGPADALVAVVRTAKAREDGGSFGYSTPAFPSSERLGAGSSRTLFTGFREAETSVFGFYSPGGAEAVFELVAPDGTVRGSLPISVTANVNEEFRPAASAFGVAEEPADVIRVSVLSGSLFAYVRILDEGTTDTALSLPAKAVTDAIFPNAGTAVGAFDTSFVSDLLLSNPEGDPATVTVTYRPLDPFAPEAIRTLVVDGGASTAIENVLASLFGVEAGQGALRVESDVPVAAALRIAARREEGDFATLAAPIEADRGISTTGEAFAVLTPTRRTNLILYNAGAAGTVTIIGVNGNDDEIGRTEISIREGATVRLNSVLSAVGSEGEPNGRIVVQGSDGTLLYGWLAQVDGPTGDVEIEALR